MSNGDPCICGATDTWHPECYQRQQEEATKAAHDEIRKQARADALREAAGVAAKFGLIDNPTTSEIYRAILSAIDQPQEDGQKVYDCRKCGYVCQSRHLPYCPNCGETY